MMSPIADPSILAPYPKKSTWVPPIGREFSMSSPVRVLMADGKWKPGVPDSLKSRYSQPIDCPPPKKGPGPVMYIVRAKRAKPKPKANTSSLYLANVTREAIEKLQEQGLNRAQIAKALNCSAAVITKRMAGTGHFRRTDRLIPKLKELHAAGWNPGRIAREIGVDRVTVVRMLRRIGA